VEAHLKRLSLTGWIFIAMVVGIVLGLVAPAFAVKLSPISNIFLRLVKSIVAPLLLGTLVAGMAGAGSVKIMGRIGIKALIYFEVLTTVALFIGLGSVNLIRPGQGLQVANATLPQLAQTHPPTFAEVLEHAFPTSLIDSMARGDVLQVVVFCFILGAACASLGPKARPVVAFCESLSEVMFKYTAYVMYLAPLGVGAAIAVTIGNNGVGVMVNLGKLLLTVYGALILFVVVVLGAVLAIAGIPIRRFIGAVKEPFVLAFSTASSESALPKALENMEAFGVPKHIVGFVLPAGYSFNLDGSTLYLSAAAIFIAQAAGVEMPWTQQLMMMLTLMLTSKGVAAVPRASLVILAGTLASFNLPVAGIGVILGIDALLDMARTSVNVLGNCAASAVVARWEGYRFDGPVIPKVEGEQETNEAAA
jgi:proton glutamate symport protein